MEALLLILGIITVLFLVRKFGRKKVFIKKEKKYYTIDDQYNADRRNREIEIDSLLAKMGTNGLSDLSEKDRKRLQELSKKIN